MAMLDERYGVEELEVLLGHMGRIFRPQLIFLLTFEEEAVSGVRLEVKQKALSPTSFKMPNRNIDILKNIFRKRDAVVLSEKSSEDFAFLLEDPSIAGTPLAERFGLMALAARSREELAGFVFLFFPDRVPEEHKKEMKSLGYLVGKALAGVEKVSSGPSGEERRRIEFLASMGHELRTPLFPIVWHSDNLLQQQGLQDYTEELEAIHQGAVQLRTLINDLMDLFKITAGKIQLHFKARDIRDCVGRSIDVIRVMAEEKGIRIRSFFEDDLPPAHIDEDRLQQVVLNIMTNAIKFMNEGGELLVTAKKDGKNALVQIIDTGIGIKEEDQKRIFDKFKQLDGETKEHTSGAGIGLSLCKDLVELHGGTIGVKSELQKGSIFYFTIPLAEAADTAGA